jgi:hypothetical protein
VPRGQRDGSLRPYSRISRPEPILFLSSSASVVLTRLSRPDLHRQFFKFCFLTRLPVSILRTVSLLNLY